MKKAISCIFVIMLFCYTILPTFSQFSFATTLPTNETIVIEHYANGDYAVITMQDASEKANTGTVTKSKYYDYYDSSNVLQWTIQLTATFTYNGTTATCTSATPGHTIYNTSWQVTKETASRSGATATGEFTIKKYVLGIPVKTVNKTLTLTCTPNGTVT